MDFFLEELYYYFGFFWNNLTKIGVFTKKLFWVLVFGFMNLVSVDAKERSKVSLFFAGSTNDWRFGNLLATEK